MRQGAAPCHFEHGRGGGFLRIGTRAGIADARRLQYAQRIAQAGLFEVQDVVVGQRAGVDAGRLQHMHRLGVGAEMEHLSRCAPTVGDAWSGRIPG